MVFRFRLPALLRRVQIVEPHATLGSLVRFGGGILKGLVPPLATTEALRARLQGTAENKHRTAREE